MNVEGPIYLVTEDIYFNFPEMMKEEKKYLIDFLKDEHIVYKNATNKVHKLQQELLQLKKDFIPKLQWAKNRLDKDSFELHQKCTQLETNWNELKKWLEEEKNRLARECSSIYEDGLGKTRLVNEDIYNEVKNISNKMQELEGKSE